MHFEFSFRTIIYSTLDTPDTLDRISPQLLYYNIISSDRLPRPVTFYEAAPSVVANEKCLVKVCVSAEYINLLNQTNFQGII